MMKKIAQMCAAGAALVMVGGFDQPLDEYLVGTWECQMIKDGNTYPVYGRYNADGTSLATAALVMSAQGPEGPVQIEISIEGDGTWAVDGNKVIETGTDLRVLSFSVNGQKAEVTPEMEAAARAELNKEFISQYDVVNENEFKATALSEGASDGVCTRI